MQPDLWSIPDEQVSLSVGVYSLVYAVMIYLQLNGNWSGADANILQHKEIQILLCLW